MRKRSVDCSHKLMTATVFVSYVFEDARHRDTIRSWATRGLLGPVVITGESADVRQDGAAAIRAHLAPRIRGASAVLLLLGNDTHNHPWIAYEAQFALSHHVRIVVVRIPGSTGTAPPILRGRVETPMTPDAIRMELMR